MARPSATLEEILAAARAAQCGDILEKLPQGIDTVVGAQGVYLRRRGPAHRHRPRHFEGRPHCGLRRGNGLCRPRE